MAVVQIGAARGLIKAIFKGVDFDTRVGLYDFPAEAIKSEEQLMKWLMACLASCREDAEIVAILVWILKARPCFFCSDAGLAIVVDTLCAVGPQLALAVVPTSQDEDSMLRFLFDLVVFSHVQALHWVLDQHQKQATGTSNRELNERNLQSFLLGVGRRRLDFANLLLDEDKLMADLLAKAMVGSSKPVSIVVSKFPATAFGSGTGLFSQDDVLISGIQCCLRSLLGACIDSTTRASAQGGEIQGSATSLSFVVPKLLPILAPPAAAAAMQMPTLDAAAHQQRRQQQQSSIIIKPRKRKSTVEFDRGGKLTARHKHIDFNEEPRENKDDEQKQTKLDEYFSSSLATKKPSEKSVAAAAAAAATVVAAAKSKSKPNEWEWEWEQDWEGNANDDPAAMIGRVLLRDFPGHGVFKGRVTGYRMVANEEMELEPLYKIFYPIDRDEEELYLSEMDDWLLPPVKLAYVEVLAQLEQLDSGEMQVLGRTAEGLVVRAPRVKINEQWTSEKHCQMEIQKSAERRKAKLDRTYSFS